ESGEVFWRVGRAEVLDDSVLPTRLVRDLHGCGARRGGGLAHKRDHSPMIRLKLVTQTREAQRPDQDECARRDQKPHLPVQVRSTATTKWLNRTRGTLWNCSAWARSAKRTPRPAATVSASLCGR